ncbi:zinc finger protein 91 [Bicyclus anynana]|uniref:Zinc finger protein 91 n=1 Tax=Bicyclus anynana TaxID=110368 RepID=A0A6J1MXX0_BICAN|nr:zinc finger protein 91 [Bicyclus anynana]
MAEDIDIEEHDLFENPIIKRMFPDLSVIKQEIMDFDEGVPVNTKIDTNIVTDEASGDVNILNKSIHSDVTNCFNTEIVLGSNPARTKKSEVTLEKEVKVKLQDMKPYLKRTMRYCDICLILFPSNVSLNIHRMRVHTALDNCVNEDFPKCTNKRKSSLCQTEFNTKDNLKRNKKNVQGIYPIYRQNIIDQNYKEKDVVPNMYELKTNVVTNLHKPCFHCQMLFPNQQDLIDHLYSVLYAKKAQVSQENIEKNAIKQDMQTVSKAVLTHNINISTKKQMEKKSNVSELNIIYSCPICSHYYDKETFCRSHCIVKHKANKDIKINTSSFNPMCKFCNSKNDNILSYNTHLRKSHEDEMVKLVSGSNNLDTNYSKNGDFTTIGDFRSQDNANLFHETVEVVVSKIILYKCSECNIHFITFRAAIKHFEHIKIQEKWKCSICHKIFKDNDAQLHQKQHTCSNYFEIVQVFAEVKPRILYKCSTCAMHFSDKISEHICKLGQPKSSKSIYCKICDILIEPTIKPSHDNDHKLRNFTQTDFEIIGTELPLINDKKHIKANPHNLQNYSKANINNKHKNIIKISKSLFAKKHLSFNYCNVCKCYIYTLHRADIHLKSLCVNIVKYICKFCGLMFSNKSIISHKRLHRNYKNLKLQDFTFYDLHTNKKMKPLIPEFPKCEMCDEHFISKFEVKGHLCEIHDYCICSICNTKFSETAYKLHMPFHCYENSKIGNKKSKHSFNAVITNNNTSTNENIVSKQDTMSIYTCKNCDLSITTYDEVIEHCHLHTNLNKIEVNAVACSECQLKFVNSSYTKHLELHTDLKNVKFSHYSFDVMYFGSDINNWLKHIYKSLPKHKVDMLIGDSIYKYETRLKMAVIQEGPSNLIIYKCEKCECVIDSASIYSHIVTCPNSEISACTFCNLSFECSTARNNHEKIHTIPDITIKSYKIVMFNREQDRNTNYNISNLKKCYVVYECRCCHVLVDIYNYNFHRCFRNDCKKCYVCGLLISADNFDDHVLKHKLVPSFNDFKIKVVLLGNQPEENSISQKNNNLVPTFNGIVCDYTFYKCIDCEVCIRDMRNTVHHSCLIDAAKARCIKCDLIFDEGKLKGHLKLHDTDPDFTSETIQVKPFTNRKQNKTDCLKNNETIGNFKNRILNNQEEVNFKMAKLYKCRCGLHYLQLPALREHMKKCSGKNKGIQTCSKCCLNFTSDVLFKHLLEHHGDKNAIYKFEIES